jgi:SAM-dependent methyltransferase
VDQIAGFLEQVLHLQPGHRVFDQCCGTGAISLALARRGYGVTGWDQSLDYVAAARAEAAPHASYQQGDAFVYAAHPLCQGGFCWGTSFGNSEDERNRDMLRRAWESLSAGGRFALDYPNFPGLFRDFQASMVKRQGDELVLRESRFDLAQGCLIQQWTTFLPDGQRVERSSRVRTYLPDQLGAMLQSVGFGKIEFFGGLGLQALDLGSPRCLVVATKEGA